MLRLGKTKAINKGANDQTNTDTNMYAQSDLNSFLCRTLWSVEKMVYFEFKHSILVDNNKNNKTWLSHRKTPFVFNAKPSGCVQH